MCAYTKQLLSIWQRDPSLPVNRSLPLATLSYKSLYVMAIHPFRDTIELKRIRAFQTDFTGTTAVNSSTCLLCCSVEWVLMYGSFMSYYGLKIASCFLSCWLPVTWFHSSDRCLKVCYIITFISTNLLVGLSAPALDNGSFVGSTITTFTCVIKGKQEVNAQSTHSFKT